MNYPKNQIHMTTQYLIRRLNGYKYTTNTSTPIRKHTKVKKHEFNFKNRKNLKSKVKFERTNFR